MTHANNHPRNRGGDCSGLIDYAMTVNYQLKFQQVKEVLEKLKKILDKTEKYQEPNDLKIRVWNTSSLRKEESDYI